MLRILVREKAFTTFAILTLGLGIGAVTTMFSVVNGVLLQPLAYKEPGRLYAAAESAPQLAALHSLLPVNAAHFRSWQEQCRSCESGALLNPASFNLTGQGDPVRIEGATCTWPVFQVLGVEPQLGRTFVASDDQPGANRFVVISNSLWQGRLGADPGIVGKSIVLDGAPHIVIGVLRADFRFPSGEQIGPLNQFPKRADIFKPMGLKWAGLRRVGQFNFASLIRLRPGVNPLRAEEEMTSALVDAGRDMKISLRAHLNPLQEQVTGGSRTALQLLLVAVGVVLLIVCINLGNLMLVRANDRTRDAAIRRALGAASGQLFRPIFTESLLIAMAGGGLGVLLAFGGVRLLVATAPAGLPRLDEVHVSLVTLLFTSCVSAGCAILCGLWPALHATNVDPADALRSGSRSATEGRAKLRSREWLVGLEVALSTILLIMAALFGLSFLRAMNVDPGYAVDRILTADLTLPSANYRTDDQRALFHQRALEKIETLPGVRSAGLVSSLPLKAQVWGDVISKEGDTRTRAERPKAQFRFVSEHYFQTMGVALREGRFPTSQDRTHKVAVISESAAHNVWPGESPLGKQVRNDPRTGWVEVIGVVADVRSESLEKRPTMTVYVPYWDGEYWQGGVWGNATYVVRTSQDASAMTNVLRSAMRQVDAQLPLANVLTMREILSESISRRKFQTLLIGVFASTALLLACLGIYGVISYSVARRKVEIGVRIAVGAQASQVSMLVLRQGIRPVLGGLFVGVTAALAGGRIIASFLFGTLASDPMALSTVVAVLLSVALVACWFPARRAARIDPMVALRDE